MARAKTCRTLYPVIKRGRLRIEREKARLRFFEAFIFGQRIWPPLGEKKIPRDERTFVHNNVSRIRRWKISKKNSDSINFFFVFLMTVIDSCTIHVSSNSSKLGYVIQESGVCGAHGRCVSLHDNQFECKCDPGYEGVHCELSKCPENNAQF